MLDVARWVREELDVLKAPGFAKTSGSGGLHIYVPLPPGTSYESGMLFCQIVATGIRRGLGSRSMAAPDSAAPVRLLTPRLLPLRLQRQRP